MPRVAGNDRAVRLLEEPPHRIYPSRWLFAPGDHRSLAIVEDAVECVYPRARRPMPERARARRVRGDHPSESAELAARRIDGKAEPAPSRRDIER
jgi:hypothetical protein